MRHGPQQVSAKQATASPSNKHGHEPVPREIAVHPIPSTLTHQRHRMPHARFWSRRRRPISWYGCCGRPPRTPLFCCSHYSCCSCRHGSSAVVTARAPGVVHQHIRPPGVRPLSPVAPYHHQPALVGDRPVAPAQRVASAQGGSASAVLARGARLWGCSCGGGQGGGRRSAGGGGRSGSHRQRPPLQPAATGVSAGRRWHRSRSTRALGCCSLGWLTLRLACVTGALRHAAPSVT